MKSNNYTKEELKLISRLVNSFLEMGINAWASKESVYLDKGSIVCCAFFKEQTRVGGSNLRYVNEVSVQDKTVEDFVLIVKNIFGKRLGMKIPFSNNDYNEDVYTKFLEVGDIMIIDAPLITPEEERIARPRRIKSYASSSLLFESFKCAAGKKKESFDNDFPVPKNKVWIIEKSEYYGDDYFGFSANDPSLVLLFRVLSDGRVIQTEWTHRHCVSRPKNVKIKFSTSDISLKNVKKALNPDKTIETKYILSETKPRRKEFKYPNPRQTSKQAIKKLINNYYNDDYEFDSIIRNPNN